MKTYQTSVKFTKHQLHISWNWILNCNIISEYNGIIQCILFNSNTGNLNLGLFEPFEIPHLNVSNENLLVKSNFLLRLKYFSVSLDVRAKRDALYLPDILFDVGQVLPGNVGRYFRTMNLFLSAHGSHTNWKTWKMGEHFPIRNFEQTGKVSEFYTKYWKN